MGRAFENVKGTYDYVPEKQIVRENIKSTLRSTFIKYGFAPVETPIICMYDLLSSKYSEGADILDEMYTLSDRGERSLGLRYDLTITLSKLISSNGNTPLPFKRYEIGKVFRDGPVKLGRNREFTQCDVDVVGVKSLLVEAEYMTMTEEAYQKLGLDIEIEFNNRKLLSGILKCVFGEISAEDASKYIILIDKFAKMEETELLEEFFRIGVSAEKFAELYALLNSDYETLLTKLSRYEANALLEEGLKEITELYGYLSDMETVNRMKFAPYLARGIDIYTGTVWEVFLKERVVSDLDFNMSLGGGGRYDQIITDFINNGKEYPAVGMSFGLDVIYEILNLKDTDNESSIVDLFVIPLGTTVDSFRFASELRRLGLRVEIEKNEKRVKKSLNYANQARIPFVVVIGENELDTQTVFIKKMISGENIEFKMGAHQEIYDYIQKNIQ